MPKVNRSNNERSAVDAINASCANDSSETAVYALQTVRIANDELLQAWPNTPRDCKDFLYQDWQTVLLRCYQRFGRDSRQWHIATQLAQDLLWLAQEPTDPKSIQRLPLLIPACSEQMIQLLTESGAPERQWRPRLDSIRSQHQGLLSRHGVKVGTKDGRLPDAAANDDKASSVAESSPSHPRSGTERSQ